MATSTVVDGLSNGVEYTFTVQAFNTAGISASSVPSNPVTPSSNSVPPPPPPVEPPVDDGCRESTLPPPPSEVRLESGALQRQVLVPCIPQFGRVRIGFFIMDYEVQILPGVGTVGDGNDRSFDPAMEPKDNKVYLEVDYRTGTGFVYSAPSCTDGTKTSCKEAVTLRDRFSSSVGPDGRISIEFAVPNSRTEDIPGPNNLAISANLDIMPVPDRGVCIIGAVSRYPSVEGYYDLDGQTNELFTLEQSDFGPVGGLSTPDRGIPGSACETTEMPPFGDGSGEPVQT